MDTETSQRILARIDAFARALEAAGIPADARSRLLESAAVAACHALTLDELLAEGDASPRLEREPQPMRGPLLVRELAA